MKQISYTSDETFYRAGKSIEAVQDSCDHASTPQEAWDLLDYWDREEEFEDFEVFEFKVTEKITQVEPPYSA